jgi:hypothetical protein
VMKLIADPARIVDMARPGNGHALAYATEVHVSHLARNTGRKAGRNLPR